MAGEQDIAIPVTVIVKHRVLALRQATHLAVAQQAGGTCDVAGNGIGGLRPGDVRGVK